MEVRYIIEIMCGGFSLHTLTDPMLTHLLGKEKISFDPNYNARPGHLLPILKLEDRSIIQKPMTWGFQLNIKGKRRTVFNAKIESLRSPFWRRMKPCLVPANGFFEWHRENGKSLPWYFKDKKSDLFFMAGLYSSDCFAVMTCDAQGVVELVHHRMPVIMQPGSEKSWLNGEVPKPYDNLMSYRVSDEVNNARINKKELIYPLKP